MDAGNLLLACDQAAGTPIYYFLFALFFLNLFISFSILKLTHVSGTDLIHHIRCWIIVLVCWNHQIHKRTYITKSTDTRVSSFIFFFLFFYESTFNHFQFEFVILILWFSLQLEFRVVFLKYERLSALWVNWRKRKDILMVILISKLIIVISKYKEIHFGI